MADFFKKKPDTERNKGKRANEPEGAASHSKRSSFLSRGPKPPREPKPVAEGEAPAPEQKLPQESPQIKRVKAERPPSGKKPRKPLFGFGKKKEERPSGAVEPETPAAPKPSRVARLEKSHKPLFGGKGAKKPKQSKAEREAEKAARHAEREAKKEARRAAKAEGHRKGAKAPKDKAPKGRGGAGKLSPVGLDIGRASLTAVQLKHQVGGEALISASVGSLPEGLFQEGEVRDVDALAEAIKEFWKAHGIKGKKVELGLANQKIVVRALEFPILEEKELRTAIEFQAQDYIPIPIEEAVFDYHVLRREKDETGIEKQRVLVVAAQKNMVMDIIQAIKKARLSVSGIDLQAFSMLRSLVPKTFLEGDAEGGAIALANIASDVTNLVVTVAGEPQFIRIVSFGGDNFTKALQTSKGISFNEAEEMKMKAGLPAQRQRPGAPGPQGPAPSAPRPEESPYGPPAVPPAALPAGMPPAPVPPAEVKQGPAAPPDPLMEVQRQLEISADALADEIRRSLDYYMSQETSVPITKLLLSGGGAMLPNLDSYLSRIFPFEVKVGDPLRRITQNLSGLNDQELKGLGPRLTIAIGLALEDEE